MKRAGGVKFEIGSIYVRHLGRVKKKKKEKMCCTVLNVRSSNPILEQNLMENKDSV